MAAVMQPKAERPEEAALTYPFATVPKPGEVFDVAGVPGSRVRWLRMNLPFALDHINLWLLEDEIDGVPCWTAVDCGVGTEPTRAAWETIFASQLDGKPIKRVIITHSHPDHVGNAEWIRARYADHGCMLTATAGEYFWSRIMCTGMSGFDNEAQVAHFRRNGLSAALCDEIERGRKRYYATLVPSVPDTFVRMRDGDTLTIGGRSWLVYTGFGHSNEHATLFCPALDIVISGDMLLPRISTNVGVWPNEPQANPLKWFLDALTPVRAHAARRAGAAFTRPAVPRRARTGGATARAPRCAAGGDARRVRQASQRRRHHPGDVFQRELDAHQSTFAIGEALAHLHYLRAAGQVTSATGADGVIRFTRI